MKKFLVFGSICGLLLVAAAAVAQGPEAVRAALKTARQGMADQAMRQAASVALKQETGAWLQRRAQARQAIADAVAAQQASCSGYEMLPMQAPAAASSCSGVQAKDPAAASSCSGVQTMMVPVQMQVGSSCSGSYSSAPRFWTPVRNFVYRGGSCGPFGCR